MKTKLSLIGFLVFLTAYAGTVIGNGRWSDHDSRITWKVSQPWKGYHQGRRITLTNKAGVSDPRLETRVYVLTRDLEPTEDLETLTKKLFLNSSYTPYSAGILNGFRSGLLESAGDPFNPRMVSRFILQNPCKADQVLDVRVEKMGLAEVDPAQYIGDLECFEPQKEPILFPG